MSEIRTEGGGKLLKVKLPNFKIFPCLNRINNKSHLTSDVQLCADACGILWMDPWCQLTVVVRVQINDLHATHNYFSTLFVLIGCQSPIQIYGGYPESAACRDKWMRVVTNSKTSWLDALRCPTHNCNSLCAIGCQRPVRDPCVRLGPSPFSHLLLSIRYCLESTPRGVPPPRFPQHSAAFNTLQKTKQLQHLHWSAGYTTVKVRVAICCIFKTPHIQLTHLKRAFLFWLFIDACHIETTAAGVGGSD